MRLSVEHISVERGGRLVLGDLTFAVEQGEALILTGPNGAGKTSLLRTLAGFLTPMSGSITLDGGNIELSVGEQAHWIGHLNGVKGSLSVAENLAFWAKVLGRSVPSSVDMALARFDLSEFADIPARALSAGQTRRLALARLAVVWRPVWLLDEPTVSLDAASQRLLASFINEHLAGGGIVIAATHIPLGVALARDLALATAVEAA